MQHNVFEATNKATIFMSFHALKIGLDYVDWVVEHGGAETGKGAG